MNRRVSVAAFAAYLALALVITYPLVRHLSDALPHDLGDPLLSSTILWWNAHSWPLTERWWNGIGFYPASGMIAFSDHRLGVSLIASPLQWFGASEITAYNLTLLLTFPLSAMAAHFLGYTLTRRHDAAALCALAYGFNPYRIAHLEHLELLAGYAMPIALAALHRFLATRQIRWIVLFAAALTLQGLSASYFLLFFCVLLALWIAWFGSARDWRFTAAVAAAGLAAGAVLSPIIVGYLQVHQHYAMTRELSEVIEFSAGLSSIAAASPLLWLWGWTSRLAPPEGQLFPGLAVTVLVITSAVAALRRARATADPGSDSTALSIGLALIGCAALAVAVSVHVAGPWSAGPIEVSDDAYKPQSIALLFFAASVAALPSARRAFRRRSPLAFYLYATAFLYLCSLGPKPAFHDVQVLYEPPYAWLMRLPIFSTDVRAPARFATPALLALSAAAAIGFARLTPARGRHRHWAFAVVALAIVADTWTAGIPMVALRSSWSPERAAEVTSVIELPLGSIEPDVAAMHRVTRHGRHGVNGYSGFVPAAYTVLRLALSEGDETVIRPIAASGPVLVALDRRADRDGQLHQLVERIAGATATGLEGRWGFFTLPQDVGGRAGQRDGDPGGAADCRQPLAITSVDALPGTAEAGALIDGDRETVWTTGAPQRAGQAVVITLAGTPTTCGLTLLAGRRPEVYPRAVAIDLSIDGEQWQTVFAGKAGGVAMAGALDDPAHTPLAFHWTAAAAARVRVRLLAAHPIYPWGISEITLTGPR